MADPAYIKLADCKNGGFYRIMARNFSFGVFAADSKGFIGIREKFGAIFLSTEYHWDAHAHLGTAKPIAFLEDCPIRPLREFLPPNESEPQGIPNDALFDWIEKAKKRHENKEQ